MIIKGLDEYAIMLDKLGQEGVEVSKKMVYAGAKVVADEIKGGLQWATGESEHSTGDLLDSLGIAPIDTDNRGNINTKVGFDGYDRKGVPNQLKARAMESGTSTQPKKPFVRPAVNRSKYKAVKEMSRVYDEEIKNIMNK